jgi:uncharacterized protein YjbI with pentapeptide repeats
MTGYNRSDAKIRQVVDFSGDVFDERVSCTGTTFKEHVTFESATFEKGADFSGATFEYGGSFESATFEQWADFSGANFGGRANFGAVTFEERVDFSHTNFNKSYFGTVHFRDGVSFRGATFSQKMGVSRETQFNNTPDFHGTRVCTKEGFFSERTEEFALIAQLIGLNLIELYQLSGYSREDIEQSLNEISTQGEQTTRNWKDTLEEIYDEVAENDESDN